MTTRMQCKTCGGNIRAVAGVSNHGSCESCGAIIVLSTYEQTAAVPNTSSDSASFEGTACPFCREKIKRDALKCRHCKSILGQGVPPGHNSSWSHERSEKEWVVTLLLCFFLGFLGVHRFYVGKIGTGILQLLLGWLTLFIWVLIDLIIIATGNFRDKNGRVIKN